MINTARQGDLFMKSVRLTAYFVVILLVSCAFQPAYAQTGRIFVTSLEDKISDHDGCSLQEAIYSSTFHANIAIAGYDPFTNFPKIIRTQCENGTGNDVIVLPAGAIFQLSKIVDDATNPFGPTATPLIMTSIIIEANGSTFQYAGTDLFRLFSVGSTGHLTLMETYIKGFIAKGGDGSPFGGGGGLGAGGAIFVHAGRLDIDKSTFEQNGAIGGNAIAYAGTDGGGGGGGIGGNGYPTGSFSICEGGGGGGGARGNGDMFCGGGSGTAASQGAGGGGTLKNGHGIGLGGFDCGGAGGDGGDAQDAPCPGGGGGGAGRVLFVSSGNGGKGNYGGGGGGGAIDGGNGGDGGFGGGGGAGWTGFFGGTRGGNGGFGGGGGAGQDGTLGGGHPGHGGPYGGNANALNGGGGGALGGAVFNDSGAVLITNSTFFNNFALRGQGGNYGNPGAADNGADAGGAIFSWQGSLAIKHSTISGNQGTGSLAGVAVSGAQFELDNTIISNNGAQECGIGTGSNATGAGNLIQTNVDCPGVVSTADPLLGQLQNNNGKTPTMALSSTSPAVDAADAGTSLSSDQRGVDRPQPLTGAFDIGAYEFCPVRHIGPIFLPTCESRPIIGTPNTQILTMIASPPAGGILIPPAGNTSELKDSVVLISAIPNPGYTFGSWTGAATLPFNPLTTVIMSTDQTITANFAPISTNFTSLVGNIVTKAGPSNARVWTLSLTDNGPAPAIGSTINTFSLTQTAGTACTPVITNLAAFPLLVGDLAVTQTGTANVTIDFTGCVAASRFTATFTFSANAGFASGTATRTNQFQ
jgi:uncharacterized repeat protein (TIGR02543 family)